jgi:glucose/arabinose dehydrogenase
MKKNNTVHAIGILALSIWVCLPLSGQFVTPINNPMPDIPPGTLAIELEDWVSIPPSDGGVPRAKISVFRITTDGRYWVNDQRGKLWVIEDQNPNEYMDLADLFDEFIDSPGLGTGFHSFAFHPQFAINGKFYTTHSVGADSNIPDFIGKATTKKGQQGVITEWTANDPRATKFSGTSREIMRIQFPGNIHCLQEINFRPTAVPGDEDYGLLYICVGDGGSYNAGVPNNTHRLDSPFGAILRIDPLGTNSANGQYGNPASNPWASDGDPETLGEIYAYGFRNPHRLTWDRGGEGHGLVGDIGERNAEELNILVAGADYGWPQREGTFMLNPKALANRDTVYPLPENDAIYGFTYPAAQYDHDDGYAIIGGYVYRGSEIESLYGKYLFGDIRNGRVFYLEASQLENGNLTQIQSMNLFRAGIETTLPAIVGRERADLRFGEGHDGELYIMTKTDGKIRKVIAPRGASGILDLNPEDFQRVADFESNEPAVSSINEDKRIINDPLSASFNRALSIGPQAGPQIIDLAEGVPSNGVGTLYFRIALSEAGAAADFGYSDLDQPVSGFQYSGLIRINKDGLLLGRDRFAFVASEIHIKPGQWYEAWLVMDSADNNYTLYLRGGDMTAPVSVLGPIETLVQTPKEVRTFGIKPASGSSGFTFIDSVYLDSRDLNFSSPNSEHTWRLISNFDNSASATSWSAWGISGASPGSLQFANEYNGNTTGTTQFSPTDSATTFINDLPIEIDVGTDITLFGRLLPVFSEYGERFGIMSSGPPQSLVDHIDTQLELYVRFLTNASGKRVLHIRHGDQEIPATVSNTAPLEFNAEPEWVNLWIVARNGGKASGGQTYDVYLQADQFGDETLLVAENFLFSQGQEIPLVGAVLHTDTAAQSFSIDDVYMAIGQITDTPNNLGNYIFPNPLGEKAIPWLGTIDDTYFPYINHPYLGWLYAFGSRTQSQLWVFENDIGWMFIDPIYYPTVYVFESGSWMLYIENSFNPRWFYNFSNREWESF